MFGEQVGDVGGVLIFNSLPVNVQGRVVVHPLPKKAFPMVKARAGFVRMASHMPFAQEGGLVAGFLQILRKVG